MMKISLVAASFIVGLIFTSASYAQNRATNTRNSEAQFESNAQQTLSCINYLAGKLQRSGSRYHIQSPNSHYYMITGGTERPNAAGTSNEFTGTGFFHLTPQGAKFCRAALVRNGKNTFTFNNETVVYGTGTSNNNIGTISPTNCDSRPDALNRMGSQTVTFINAYVQSQYRSNNAIKGGDIARELFPHCGQVSGRVNAELRELKRSQQNSPSPTADPTVDQ